MEQKKAQQSNQEEGQLSEPSREKARWEEPKLAFVKPKLSKHGELKEVTAGFFGHFTP